MDCFIVVLKLLGITSLYNHRQPSINYFDIKSRKIQFCIYLNLLKYWLFSQDTDWNIETMLKEKAWLPQKHHNDLLQKNFSNHRADTLEKNKKNKGNLHRFENALSMVPLPSTEE